MQDIRRDARVVPGARKLRARTLEEGIRELLGPLTDTHISLPSYNPMRAGILISDEVNTVSPRYAREITRPDDPARNRVGGELQDLADPHGLQIGGRHRDGEIEQAVVDDPEHRGVAAHVLHPVADVHVALGHHAVAEAAARAEL